MTMASIYRMITASLVFLAFLSNFQIVTATSGTPVPVFAICGIIPADAGTPLAGDGSTEAHAHTENEIEFDLLFIDLMIPHHQSAVVMAQVALERSDRPEIRDLAEAIIEAQTTEIEQLQSWREEWFPGAAELTMPEMITIMTEYETGTMDMGGAPMDEMAGMDLASALITMCNAPEPFDLAFIDEMIPHHESAISMANVGLEQSTHQELKELQLQIIGAQQSEIDQMTAWRSAWFAEATPVAT